MINIEVPTRHLRHEEDGLSAKEWVASHHVRGLSTFLVSQDSAANCRILVPPSANSIGDEIYTRLSSPSVSIT